MKNYMYPKCILASKFVHQAYRKFHIRIVLVCCLIALAEVLFAQKVKFDEIKNECPDLPLAKKVRISVSSFQVSTIDNPGRLGDELAQMLTDALQNVNCFNVLLSLKDVKEIQGEITYGQSGNTEEGSSPETGKQKGAQVVVIGKVTSYSSGEKSGGGGGITITGGNKVKVGFIIQLVNPQTRELIASTPIEVEGKTGGFTGVKVFGMNAGGGSNNKAVDEVLHKGIIQAAEFIASKKDQFALPEANSGVAAVKSFNAANCAVLNSSHVPKIMVILPEFHISQRIPDPAAETEINRKFIEAGFQVVDPAMFATINNSIQFKDAADDPARAISLGRQFGADIVIYGEAFSQRPGTVNAPDLGTQNGQASVRARVEVRAVRTDNATILATNGLEAGALDNAEFVAAKAALRKAGALMADYLLQQFCSKDLRFSNSGGGLTTSLGSKGNAVTEIDVNNANYSKIKPLLDLLLMKGKIIDKSISGGTAYIQFEHGAAIDVADLISSKLGDKYDIKDFSNVKVILDVK